jgi:starch synthase
MADERQPLRILIMTAQKCPFCGHESIATITDALASALHALGHDVRVAIPRYGSINPESLTLEPCVPLFDVPMNEHSEPASAYRFTGDDGVPVYMLDSPRYFSHEPAPLSIEATERFVFYSRCTLELLKRPEIDWRPDVIHCHDWQTALAPNYLDTLYRDDPFYANTASVFTIYQLAHQGIVGYHILEMAGLKELGFIRHADISDLDEMVDLMARGIYYADAITTVSECYAQQIQTPEFGERLDPLLRERGERLFGVLNGIDMQAFDPAHDAQIAARFDAAHLDQRSANKVALQRFFGLQENPDLAIIAFVSPLQSAQGLGLFANILKLALTYLPVQFAIIGNGELAFAETLQQSMRAFPGRLGLRRMTASNLSKMLYAGSDLFLAPAYREPCALDHLIAMRYGSVPIVSALGSLADTVRSYDPAQREGNGFAFEADDPMALYTTLARAVEVFRHRECWATLQRRCLESDYSWATAAVNYERVYRWARAHHRPHTL